MLASEGAEQQGIVPLGNDFYPEWKRAARNPPQLAPLDEIMTPSKNALPYPAG